MMTKTINGAMDVDTGHMASMLTEVNIKEMIRVFTGPSLSPRKPQSTRPTADEKLKQATNAAPIWGDKWIDWA